MASPSPPAAAAQREPSGEPGLLARAVPTALVLAALGGLFAVGHFTHWKLPKLSAYLAGAAVAEEPWCAEHSVPEAICIECNADLAPRAPRHGWCKQHGVSECPLCHPGVAQLAAAWTPDESDVARAAQALASLPRVENSSLCRKSERRIQFVSAEAADKSGVDIAIVERQPILEAISAAGIISYDPTHLAHLSSPLAGMVWRAEKKTGDPVARGDVLALIDAVEVGRAKAALLQSLAQLELRSRTFQRLASLTESGIVAQRQHHEAETALSEARIAVLGARQALVNFGLPVEVSEFAGLNEAEVAARIQFLGVPEALVRQFDPGRTTANLLPIVSPLEGVVVEQHATPGEVADSSKALFTVADTRRMWLTLDARLEDAKRIAVGQEVLFRPDGTDGAIFGTVSWISTAVEPRTRTVQIRAELENADGRLRDETFGVGQIVLRRESRALVVPSEAVHWEGCCHVVFVRDKNYHADGGYKFYHARTVRPGARDGQFTEIIAGVAPGEVVASRGSGALRGELLRANLGAGCCEPVGLPKTPKKQE